MSTPGQTSGDGLSPKQKTTPQSSVTTPTPKIETPTNNDNDDTNEVGTGTTPSTVESSLAIGESESGTNGTKDFDLEVNQVLKKITEALRVPGGFLTDLSDFVSVLGDANLPTKPGTNPQPGTDTAGAPPLPGSETTPPNGDAPDTALEQEPAPTGPVTGPAPVGGPVTEPIAGPVTEPVSAVPPNGETAAPVDGAPAGPPADAAAAAEHRVDATKPAEVAPEVDYRMLIRDKIEGLPKFETLTSEQMRNYQLYREQFLKLMPVVKLGEQLGSHQNDLQMALVKMRLKEENPDRRKKIEEILQADPLTDRSKALKELKDLYGADSESAKTLDKLISDQNGSRDKVQLLDRITWNEQNLVLFDAVQSDKMKPEEKADCYRSLMDRHASNPEKQAVIRDNFAQMLLQELQTPGIDAKTSPALQELARIFPDDKAITQLVLDFKAGKNDKALDEIKAQIKNGPKELETIQKDARSENYELMMGSYSKVSDFFKSSVPQTIVAFDRMLAKIPEEEKHKHKLDTQFPDDCPIELPKVEAGKDSYPATWKGFLDAVKTGDAKLVLPEKPQDLLNTNAALDKFLKTSNFWTNTESVIARNQRIHDAINLNKLLKEDFGAGPGWEMPPIDNGERLDGWHSSALEMTNLLMRVKNYTQAYKSLQGIAPDVNRDHAIEALRDLGAKIEFDPKTGKITEFKLPLPKELNQKDLRNSDQIKALENWLTTHRGPVDKAIDAFKKGHSSYLRQGDFIEPGKIVYDKENPSRMLMLLNHAGDPQTLFHRVGDKDIPVHRNTDGKFIYQETTSNGEKVERELQPDMSKAGKTTDYQYTRQFFTSAEVTDPKTGEKMIQFTVTRMPCTDNAANYQYFGSDIDANFNTNLCAIEGAKFTETITVPPDTYMGTVHNTVGRMEVQRADELHNGWWKWRQQNLFHYGAKLGNVGLDVGMTTAALAEIAANPLSIGVVLPAMRLVIGASGFLAPALRTGAIEPFGIKGETWLKARGIAMMVDVYGIGLGGGALKMLTGGGAKTAEALGVLEKFAHQAHTVTNVTGFLYGPIILRGIADKWDAKHGRLAEQRIPRAMVERGIADSDFSTLRRYDMADQSVRRETSQMLDGMKRSLQNGSPETNQKVERLFETAKEILSLPKDDPRRQRFVGELVGMHRPSADNLLASMMANNADHYTTDIPKYDDDRKLIPDEKAAGNRKLLEGLKTKPTLADVSEQEKVASAQLLLLLSANADGTLPQDGVIGSREIELPDHDVKRSRGSEETSLTYEWTKPTDQERKQTQSFTADEAFALLRERVTSTPQDAVDRLAKGSVQDASKFLQMQLGVNADVADGFATKLVAGDAGTSRMLAERLATPMQAERLTSADYLWRLGKISNREMAAVALDVFRDRRLPDQLRGSALVDSSGYRLGGLMADLKAEEIKIASGEGAGRMAALGKIYGSRSDDMERALIEVISADGRGGPFTGENADLRALASRVLAAQKNESVEGRLTELKKVGEGWTNWNGGVGTYAQPLLDELKAAMERPVAGSDEKSTDEIRSRKFDATLMLAALGKVETATGTYQLTRQEYNQRLLESTSLATGQIAFNKTNPEITHKVLTALDYNQLTIDQKQLVMNVLDIPRNAGGDVAHNRDIEVAKILVMRNLKSLTGEGKTGIYYDLLRSSAQEKVLGLFNAQSVGTATSTYAAGQPELRLEAVRAIRDLGWRDHRIQEVLEARLYQGPTSPGANDKVFYEPSAAVRRASLEALWKMNPLDPGKIALSHRDVERDPLTAKVDEFYRSNMEERKRGDARKESEIAQAAQYDLLEPHLLNDERGKKLLEDQNQDFRLLLNQGLRAELEAKFGDAYSYMVGGVSVNADLSVKVSGLSFGVLWDRVSSFDFDAPNKKHEKVMASINERHGAADRDLIRRASTPGTGTDALTKQIDAINAMGYLLEHLSEVGANEYDRFYIAQNLARGLKNLTTGENVIVNGETVNVPQQAAESAFRWSRRLLRNNNVDSGVRLELLDGLKNLHTGGKISTTDYVSVLNDTLRMGHENRDFGREVNERDRIKDEKLHQRMLEDYLNLQVRTPEVKGHLLAYSKRHPYNMEGDGHINVKKQAELIYNLLDQGVTLARDDVRKFPDLGSSAEQRAQNLQFAMERYGKKALTKDDHGVAIENASDELVNEVFRSMTGVPVTSMTDPRIAVLKELGNHNDIRVRAAAAHALIDSDFGNGSLALDGYTKLKQIADDPTAKKDMPGLVWETEKRLDTLRKLGDRGETFLKQLGSKSVTEASSSLITQFNSAKPGSETPDVLNQQLDRLYRMNSTGNLRDESTYVQAIVKAWTNPGSDAAQNKLRLDLTNRIFDSSATPPKVKVAAALALMKSDQVSAADKKFTAHQLTKLKETVSDAGLKGDIDRIIANDLTDKPSPQMALLAKEAAALNMYAPFDVAYKFGDEEKRVEFERIKQIAGKLKSSRDPSLEFNLKSSINSLAFSEGYKDPQFINWLDQIKRGEIEVPGSVRDVASQASAHLHGWKPSDGTYQILQATVPDTATDKGVKAQMIKEALAVDPRTFKYDSQLTVREIFRLGHPSTFTDKDDPRFEVLTSALEFGDDRVKMAAARVLLAVDPTDARATTKVVELLDSPSAVIKSEAHSMLEEAAPITREDDPRRKSLHEGLGHLKEQVRLSSAWLLSKSSIQVDFDRALLELSEMGMKGKENMFINGNIVRTDEAARSLMRTMIDNGSDATQARVLELWGTAFGAYGEGQKDRKPPELTDIDQAKKWFRTQSQSGAFLATMTDDQKKALLMHITDSNEDQVDGMLAPPIVSYEDPFRANRFDPFRAFTRGTRQDDIFGLRSRGRWDGGSRDSSFAWGAYGNNGDYYPGNTRRPSSADPHTDMALSALQYLSTNSGLDGVKFAAGKDGKIVLDTGDGAQDGQGQDLIDLQMLGGVRGFSRISRGETPPEWNDFVKQLMTESEGRFPSIKASDLSKLWIKYLMQPSNELTTAPQLRLNTGSEDSIYLQSLRPRAGISNYFDLKDQGWKTVAWSDMAGARASDTKQRLDSLLSSYLGQAPSRPTSFSWKPNGTPEVEKPEFVAKPPIQNLNVYRYGLIDTLPAELGVTDANATLTTSDLLLSTGNKIDLSTLRRDVRVLGTLDGRTRVQLGDRGDGFLPPQQEFKAKSPQAQALIRQYMLRQTQDGMTAWNKYLIRVKPPQNK